MKVRVLFVDDDPKARKDYTKALKEIGLVDSDRVMACVSGEEACSLSHELVQSFDVAVIDQEMGRLDGFETASRLRKVNPMLCCIMLTAYGNIEKSVKALRDYEFFDYLTKPCYQEDLERSLSSRRISDIVRWKRDLEKNLHDEIIGDSTAIKEIKEKIAKCSISSDDKAHVLLLGESGVGKTSFARLLHKQTKSRSAHKFIEMDCGCISEHLFESEMYGTVRGAYSGAQDKIGAVELADNGTLFMDDIQDMTISHQQSFRRFIQENRFARVGQAGQEKKVNVRIVAASNKNLHQMVKDGLFQLDVYQKLRLITITIPTLRERKEDIPLLVSHFLKKYPVAKDKYLMVDDATLAKIKEYPWTENNVRELENAIRRAIIFSPDGRYIHEKHIFEHVHMNATEISPQVVNTEDTDPNRRKADIFEEGLRIRRRKRDIIVQVLGHDGSSSQLAQVFDGEKMINTIKTTLNAKKRWPFLRQWYRGREGSGPEQTKERLKDFLSDDDK